MTINDLAKKLNDQIVAGHGPEEIKVLDTELSVLMTVSSVGTFANEETGKDEIVIVAKEAA
jgi:hypothetical protein